MRLLSVLLTACLLTGLSAQQTARVVTTVTKGTPAWHTWKNDLCALTYPEAWGVDNSGITGTVVTFLAPRDSNGVAHARMEMSAVPFTGTLDDLVAARKIDADLHLGNVRMIADERDGDHQLREAEGTRDGRPMHVLQQLRVHGGQAYTLLFIADAGAYEEYFFQAEAITNSFRFLP